MSQNTLIIANGSGSTVRSEINSALDTLATTDIGGSRPSGIQAGQPWINNTSPSGTTWSLYYYDGTHDVKIGEINSTSGQFTPFAAGASILAGGTTNTSSGSLATMANVQASMLGGYVNKFRNAAMDVWQRGTSGTITAGSPAYTADGWIVGCTGANVPWTQTAGRNLTAFALKITGAASVTDALVKQRIESYLCYSLAGQVVTIQAKIYNNTGGSITPTITVKHATATDNWASTSTDVNAVNLQACSNTTLTTVAYAFTASSSSGNGLEVTIDFGNNFSSSGKSVEVSEFEIRVTPGVATGTVASAPVPELRPVTEELPYCQRYLPSYRAATSSENIIFGASDSTTTAEFIFPFLTQTRIAPTGLTVSSNGHFAFANPGQSAQTCTGLSFADASNRSCHVTGTVASGLSSTAGLTALFSAINSSASLLFTGAEL